MERMENMAKIERMENMERMKRNGKRMEGKLLSFRRAQRNLESLKLKA